MTTDDGLLSRVALRFRQRVCGLHGHDSLLNFDNGRMSLLCSSCGHQSPGWDLAGNRATAPQPMASARVPHEMPARYAGERKVA